MSISFLPLEKLGALLNLCSFGKADFRSKGTNLCMELTVTLSPPLKGSQ